MIVTFSMLTGVLAACAYVTASVMKNIDKIGDLHEVKLETISKSLFNFYAVAVLCVASSSLRPTDSWFCYPRFSAVWDSSSRET